MNLFLLSHFPILNGQESRTLTKQFRKPARSRVADHFRNLSYREIRINQQMLCLAHAALLNILCDCAALQLLKRCFQLGGSHTGDFCKPLQWDIKRIVVIEISSHILQLCYILVG